MLSIQSELKLCNDQLVCLIPNALSVELCQLIIRNFELDLDGQAPGSVINYTKDMQPLLKKTKDLPLSARSEDRSDLWGDIDLSLCKIIGETWNHYLESTKTRKYLGGSFIDSGFLIQKYQKGQGFFKPHIDVGSVASCKRVAACIVYLNDVIKGGETKFTRLDYKIPCRTGSLVWFPAGFTHPHQGLVPLSNDKYIITSFMEFKDEQ